MTIEKRRRGKQASAFARGTVAFGLLALSAVGVHAQSLRLVPSATRFAGSPQTGSSSDFGIASSLVLNQPAYTAVDHAGNVYIADTANNCVRRVDPSGNMNTVAGVVQTGSGDTCYGSHSTSLTASQGLVRPSGLAVDASGNLFIADTGHNCIRELPAGSLGTGSLRAVMDTCSNNAFNSVVPSPAGLAIDGAGTLYIAISDNMDGTFQVLAAPPGKLTQPCVVEGTTSARVSTPCPNVTPVDLNAPQGLAADPIGNLYIADSGNACVREVAFNGAQSTVAGLCANDGTGSSSTAMQTPTGVAADGAGNLYISDYTTSQVFELLHGSLFLIGGLTSGQSGAYDPRQEGKAAVVVPLFGPKGLSVDSYGDVFVADTQNNIVRNLTNGLHFNETFVGGKSAPQTLQFVVSAPVRLSGSIGTDYQILSNLCNGTITPSGNTLKTCEVNVRFTPTLPGLRRAPLTLSDSVGNAQYRFGLNGVGQSAEANFLPGTIKILAAKLASPSAVAVNTAGDIYFAESGTGSANGDIAVLRAGSSTPAELVAPGAGLSKPTALALDDAGNLYIADKSADAVFQLDVNGKLTKVVSGLNDPEALVVDSLGDIYIAQDGPGSVGILEVFAGGQQHVIAGQGTNAAADNVLATTAQFIQPSALYLDSNGVLYVADRGAYRIYQIDTAGIIHFFAGNGTQADTQPGTRLGTSFPGPVGLSGDAAGDIYVADAVSNRVFVAFSGLAQNPAITSLVGDGTAGAGGDGGPATRAQLNTPLAVALDGAANIYVVDGGNASLRAVTYVDPLLDFGVVKIGQTGGPLTTTLWNAGNDVLQPIQSLYLDDTVNFAENLDTSGCGNDITSGATCDLAFDFMPQSPGTFRATATLTDSSINPTQAIALQGEAPPPPQATINAPAVTTVYGTPYTLSATAAGNQQTAPTGMLTFSIGTTALCPTAPLPANDTLTCAPSPTLENVGTYSVTVAYSGDSNFPATNSTIALTVLPAPVTVEAANVTRPVNTANPALTGTVTGVVPGQSILASYSTTADTSSPAGTYPILPAVTAGPSTTGGSPVTLLTNYAITIVNGTLTVTDSGSGDPGGPGGPGGPGSPGSNTGNFSISANPPEQEIASSGSVKYQVSLASVSGFAGTVTLSCSGLPEDGTCNFAPAGVALAAGGTGTAVMTVAATANATNVPLIFGRLTGTPAPAPDPSSPLLAWTMLPLGLGGTATVFASAFRRKRGQPAGKAVWWILPLALILAGGISGCCKPSAYKVYTITVTGTSTSGGSPITQSTTVALTLVK